MFLVKVTNFKTLGIAIEPVLPSKKFLVEGQGLTAVEKIFNKTQLELLLAKFYMQDQMYV
jgi:hypothetical protein